MSPRVLFSLFLAAGIAAARAEVVIDEIMYHPQSENSAEEFVELYNSDGVTVDVSGWKFANGVQFTFPPATSIPAGGYLVVTANPAVFHAKYPAVVNYVAIVGWIGQLSNSSNRLQLDDALGVKRDEVKYADDGDWAVRVQDTVADFGHKGWSWNSDADGGGKSLELINRAFDNNLGQNWAASVAVNGTPGAPNGVAAAVTAPFILDVTQFPFVPTPTDPVVVTARIVAVPMTGLTITAHYRLDGVASFTTVTMFDDGAHGDALAGDGIYGVSLPAQANDAIVEYYVQATDAGARTRTWPAPAVNASLVAGQFCNCLYEVDDTVFAGAMPYYKMVMRAVDKAELTQINRDTPAAPFATSDQTYSHARMNATWITSDGTSNELRYVTGVRNRGHGSRSRLPQSYNITFTNDVTWKGVTALNLNTQHTEAQLFGSALFRASGLTGPDSRQVQLRVNGVDPTGGSGSAPSFGYYCANEVEDNDFADHHYPLDSSGNIYRGKRLDSNAQEANFSYIDNDPNSYRPVYFKKTNTSEDDWTDLIGLCFALSKGHSDASFNTTYDAGYEAGVEARADVREWMRYFAVNTLVDNSETAISNGYGDDFFFYFGVNDPRATLMPYDLDTICGQGDSVPTPTQHGLFRMVNKDNNASNGPTVMNSFVKNPTFVPIYFDELRKLLDGIFATANFDALADQVLAGVVPAGTINSIKTFQTARSAYVATLIPLNISVTSGPAVVSGYPHTTTATTDLVGKANAITTRSVKISNGPSLPIIATWSAWQAQWTANNVVLRPGINRVLIQAFDGPNGTGTETEESTYDVWYDDASVVSVSGTIASNTVWSAAAGPYLVTANLTVNSGATLTIQPGTTVYLNSGVNLVVANGGRILAEGTETQPIRFSRTPGTAASWGKLTINGGAGSPETRIAYAHFEFNGGSPCILSTNATIYLDHLTFGNTAVSYLHLDGSSFLVSNCIFPDATTGFELVHGTGGVKSGGYGIIRDCYFGNTSGYNDIVDFTGGSRPGTALIQFYNNVFTGATDDILDLDGTDAWVEGNIFLHSHKNGSPDTSTAVSGGEDQGATANKSEITIIGNIFYDCDGAMTAKEGNFYTMINNTIVHQTRTGGTETRAGVVNLADDGIAQGLGTYLEGNIIYDIEALERSYAPPLTSVITFNNNILPFPWSGPGSGNTIVDPRFKHVPAVSETNFATFQAAQIMRDWFSLLPGSPAIGTGPNGRDKGAVTTRGASIGGAPTGTTNLTTATLTVGSNATGFSIPTTPWPNGSGFTHYRWKLDAGTLSAETPITTPISLAGLTNGPHTVSVIGKNDVGTYQDDAKLGTDATVTTAFWTVDTSYIPPAPVPNVVISEVLAKNSETLNFGTTFPDLIELHNIGGATADLSGWGLTDNPSLPYKYTFPPGSMLTAGAYLVIYADSSASVPSPKTGFSLKQGGDDVTLTRSPAAGGGIADSVAFGAQLADYSIGRRVGDGVWDLCRPTFGGANVVAAQEVPARVLINEWLADAQVLANNDFIELYNPTALPVNVGGCYLTNNPVEYVTQHQILQLTFIAPAGYVFFKADGDVNQGADHLSFKLSPLQGEIGFFDPAQKIIDRIIYGPQSTDVSQGRSPNGSQTIAFFNQPTPGGPNPSDVSGGGGTTVVSLIPATQSWKYFSGVTAAPANDASSRVWNNKLFTDAAWTTAAQLLFIETDPLNNSEGFGKTTVLPGLSTTKPYQTYYFRTHFNYSGTLSGVTLDLTTMVDDGAVVYLNGTEVQRIGMTGGTVVWDTLANRSVGNASVESFTIPASQLVVGDNVLAVEVHQAVLQSTGNSSDIVWGAKLDATVPVAGSATAVVINEVLASNATLGTPDGAFSGWIELFNTSASAVSVADMSVTDNTAEARKWVFPAGASVPAGGYLVVFCNPLLAASATNGANMNTGFGLNAVGDRVFLFKKLADGGGLLDSVVFGQQVPDRSIGRIANGVGAFTLNVATRGALNSAAGLGAITTVKVNEWLALPPAGPGWFELHNGGASPVLLSGNYLTDNLSNKTKFLVGPLTFIGGTANLGNSRWLQLFADNDNGATPGHVNFSINPAGEALGIFSGSGVQLESVAFGPQSAGISGGRYPDGSASLSSALLPTPGAANAVAALDSDGDGIPDDWELANGLDPNDPLDAALDADGDGQSNRAEYLAGTDPQSSASHLAARLVPTLTPGEYAVRFTAVAGKTYTVRYKNALTDGTWTKLADIPAPVADTLYDVIDPVAGSQTKRFYQVITPQQP